MAHEIVYFSYSLDPSVDVPGQEDVFAVDPDTGVVRRLTDDSSALEFLSDRDPVWSPDRSRVAIHRALSGNAPTIVILDAASGDTIATVADGVSPEWLDDSRLAFLAPYELNRVLTAEIGGEVTELVTLPTGGAVSGMSWHPEQGLAFGYDDPGELPGMVAVVPAPAIEQAVTSGVAATSDAVLLHGRIGGAVILPAWSPDGSQLAVSSYDPGTWSPDDTHIGLLDITQHTYRRLPSPSDGLISVHATWSPDGSRLAFMRGHEDQWSEVWVYDVATAALTQLTDDGRARFKGTPDW